MHFQWDEIRNEIVGSAATILTPYGERYITYADYTASGRGVEWIERYMHHLLQHYANTHTEDDSTGKLTSRRFAAAMSLIKKRLNADDSYHLIPIGTGATGAINRLQEILGIYIPPATRNRVTVTDKGPVVFVGPYEHHSNEISWRECIAEVVEVGLDGTGALSLSDLEAKLTDPRWEGREKIGAFSAASNVTGICTDVYEAARILHRHGGRAFFDFSARAPYDSVDVRKDDERYFDGIYFSPHKYLGGPGASGILLIHKSLYRGELPPSVSGGGTVRFVSETRQDYIDDVEAREQAGTPGILQVMKAALAIDLQHGCNTEAIQRRETELLQRAYQRCGESPEIVPLVPEYGPDRLAIFSFNIRPGKDYLHPRFVVRLLNDLFGIQARAGCSCAGPYGHRLLQIDPAMSEEYFQRIRRGEEGIKPGWVRMNFHYLLTDEEFEYIWDAIAFVARYGRYFLAEYSFDNTSGAWTHREDVDEIEGFGIAEALAYRLEGTEAEDHALTDTASGRQVDTLPVKRRYLDEGLNKAFHLSAVFDESRLRTAGSNAMKFLYMEKDS
jgi:selenocysteine lyase/cysteine desulfurase